ncbi:MAG: glycosyltransferase family 4 protein [Casimicrobiaceae bacterium]
MPPVPAKSTLHLINPLRNPYGGSERRTIDTARLLQRVAPVTVWCARDAAPALKVEADAKVINPIVGSFPRRGTLVFIGTYFSIGRWIALAAPKRVLIIFNTDQPRWLRDNLTRIAHSGRSADVVYTSHALRERHRGVGPVLESPIDLAQFTFRDPREVPVRAFTVGRHSRDDLSKHHADDVTLYRRLAQAGVRVRLMGATCLAPQLAGTAGIDLLPEGAQAPLDFLRSLDAFVYRTSDNWYEAFGRVVFEAMAAGVPVACGSRGGYAGYLEHGRTAMLGKSTDELAAAVLALRDNPAMAATIACEARRTAQTVQRDARRQMIRLLVGTPLACDDSALDAFAMTQPLAPGD